MAYVCPVSLSVPWCDPFHQGYIFLAPDIPLVSGTCDSWRPILLAKNEAKTFCSSAFSMSCVIGFLTFLSRRPTFSLVLVLLPVYIYRSPSCHWHPSSDSIRFGQTRNYQLESSNRGKTAINVTMLTRSHWGGARALALWQVAVGMGLLCHDKRLFWSTQQHPQQWWPSMEEMQPGFSQQCARERWEALSQAGTWEAQARVK